MGRIRTLKPELLEDARTAGLTDSAFRLFVAAILLADDYGNLRADERWLDGQIWWARGDSRNSAAALLELSDCGLAYIYRVRGQFYMAIRGWQKHQRIDNAGKPRVPQMSDPEAEVSPNFAANLRETPLYLRPPTSDPDHDHEQERARDKLASPSAGLLLLKAKVDSATGDIGKRRARKARPELTAVERAAVLRVLEKLSAQSGVSYSGSDEHLRIIVARLRDGITETDLRAVIGYCALELKWASSERMRTYLRPKTLFGPEKIHDYLDPARTWFASLPSSQPAHLEAVP